MITIAEQCKASEDPYGASVKCAAYKGMPSPFMKVFHFEDGSYLSFKIHYTPAETGRSMPCETK